MIEFAGKKYFFVQLDTCIISEMLKHPKGEFKNYIEKYFVNNYLPGISVFTLLEIMDADNVFDLFLYYFSIIPCFIIQGYEELLKMEVKKISDNTFINPILLSTMSITGPSNKSKQTLLKSMLLSNEIQNKRKNWHIEKDIILDSILSLRKYFPPKSNSYSKKEIKEFINLVVREQLVFRGINIDFNKQQFNSNLFPSLKSMAFSTFMKFYYHPQRKPLLSDVFDIVMSASIPYVECWITDKQMESSFTEIRKIDPFLNNIKIQSISCLR